MELNLKLNDGFKFYIRSLKLFIRNLAMKDLSLFILLVFFTLSLVGQEKKYLPPKFQNLSLKQGLSNLSVRDIIQDDLGYIWIATARGLNRYDGTSFKQYYSGKNPNSLHDDFISDLFKNFNGYIFCISNGLNYYDPYMDELKCFQPADIKINLFCDYRNQTYGTLLTGGLVNLIPEENKILPIDSFPKNNSLNSLIAIENQGIWGTNFENTFLFHYSPERKKYERFDIQKVKDPSPKTATLKLNDFLVLGILKKFFFFDLNTRRFVEIPEKWNRLKEIEKNTITFISEIEPDILWIGTKENGLYIFDLNANTYSNYTKTNKQLGLKTNHLTAIYKDNKNNIWLGTFDQGIEVSFERRKNFNFDLVLSDFTQNRFITSIITDNDGIYFMGTRSDGLYIYNSKTKSTQILNSSNSFIDDNHIRTVTFDSRGKIWIGTESSLFIYDHQTRASKQIDIPNPNNGVVCFCEQNNQMFAGTDGTGLLVYSLDGKLEKTILKLGINITQILKYNDRELILSSFGRGILKYNYENDVFINLAQKINVPEDKLFSIITCFFDSKKDLWIGNFKHGLFRIRNERPDSLEIYTTNEGLPSSDITGILEDLNGNIWISTAYGLSRFDKKKEFTNFFYNEGLENIQFHQKAALIDEHGTLFLGGNFGLTFFNPGIFGDEKRDVPQIIFEKLKVSNNEVRAGDNTKILSKAISKTNKITLNHHYPAFSIEYKGFDFIAANNLKYAYQLEGYDKDWNYVDNRTFAGYSNLTPNDYTFRVKVQNNNGVWSEPAILEITIKPAPWKTIWAFLVYVILLATIAHFSFRLVLRAKLVKKELEIEHNERLRDNEVSKMKIKFFTNISHELRTPLTLIKGNVDYLAAELARMKIDLAMVGSLQNSTNRLLRLANQLLSFRQLENDTLKLEIKEEDVIELTKNLIESFKYTARLKSISIEIESDHKELKVPLDSDKYEKIVSNLINNSLKFTEESGLIIIKIGSCKKEDVLNEFGQNLSAENFTKVSVIDDGKGIPPEKLPFIFERFVHYDKSKKKPDYSGSGIGLDFTKRLVEMHQGYITVTSKENIETCFCFIFPTDKSAYPEEVWQISSFTEQVKDAGSIDTSTAFTELSEPNENKKTILLVEDDVELNQFICNAIKTHYKIIPAFDGKEAYKLIKNHIPDIIISDIKMPEMDGIELCKSVRSDNLVSHIPIILLTAKSEVENRITGYSFGADDYLVKPFDLEILKSRIANLINQRKKLRNYYKNAFPDETQEGNINQFEISFMKKVSEVIKNNYTSPDFNVNRLAEEMNMSRTSFYRKFMSIADMSPKDYLTRYRINKSIELIKSGEENFAEISYLCGFNSQSIFSVIFKKEKGVSPLQFKKSYKRDNFQQMQSN